MKPEARMKVDFEIMRAKGGKVKEAMRIIYDEDGEQQVELKKIDLNQKHNWSYSIRKLRMCGWRRGWMTGS